MSNAFPVDTTVYIEPAPAGIHTHRKVVRDRLKSTALPTRVLEL